MDADIDRILSLSGSLGSLDLGLDEGLNMCLDDQQRRDQSISPQSVIGTATAAAATPPLPLLPPLLSCSCDPMGGVPEAIAIMGCYNVYGND